MARYISLMVKGYIKSYSGLPILCWKGIFLNFVESSFVGVNWFLYIYFVQGLKLNFATAGMIISFFGLGTIIGGLLGGKLSDIFSPGAVSKISLFIQAIVFLLLVKLRSVYWLTATVFLMGVACYGFITSNYLWVLQQCRQDEAKRLQALNMLNVASNLGVSLAAFIISLLADLGFQYIFYISSIMLFLAAVYFSFVEQEARKLTPSGINQAAPVNLIGESDKTQGNKKILYLVLGCLFLSGLIIFQLGTTYSIYIQEIFPQLGLKGVSILFALNSLLVVFLQAPIGKLFGRYNKLLLVGVGVFLLGFGMLMLNFSFVFSFAVIACIIYTFGEMLFFSVAQLVCYQNGGEKKKGQRLGIYRMVYASSRVVAPTAGSFAYQRWGGGIVWYLCGLIGVMCLLACGYFRNSGE